MSQNHPQNHQVGATWQSIWMNLINQSVTAYFERRYIDSFQALRALFPWLPEECKEELEKSKEIIEKGCKDVGITEGYFPNQINRQANAKINRFLREKILEYSSEIQQSLEAKKWISREDNVAQPLYRKKGHL